MIAADRFKSAIAAVVAELLPNRRFLCPVEYRVKKAEGGKFSAIPTEGSMGFPPITDAPIRGMPGANAASKLPSGSSVLVAFINGDRAKPFLLNVLESPDELALEAADKITADAPQIVLNGGAQGVARLGDMVAGMFPITTASPTVRSG